MKNLEIPNKGRNLDTLKNKIQEYNIDISSITGRVYETGINHKGYVPASEYFNDHKFIKTSKLKEKLLKEGYKENKCECCGITEWNNKPIVMQLHHIDGNSNNNRLENLQMLCPNCHSQTDNFCGSANITENTNKKYYCPDCGKEINKGSNYCPECAKNHRKDNLSKCPPLEQLIKDFLEIRSYVGVGDRYEVSDSAVKKWIQKYNLPYHIKELLEFIQNHSIEEIIKYSNTSQSEVIISKKTTTKYDYDLILKLIDLKYSIPEITKYINCSPETVKLVGIKYKHSIRKSNLKCIGCYKDEVLVKYCFGSVGVANWLISQGYNEYATTSLADKVNPAIKGKISINGYIFKNENLPDIEELLNNNQEEYLKKLIE